MNPLLYTSVLRKYKKCPVCGASWKTTDMYNSLENEVITIGCKCGWEIKVDENNKEIK